MSPPDERKVILLDDPGLSLPTGLQKALERDKRNKVVKVNRTVPEDPLPSVVLDHEGLILRKRPEVRRFLRMVRAMLKRKNLHIPAQVNHLVSQDCCRAEPWAKTSEKLVNELRANGKLEDKQTKGSK